MVFYEAAGGSIVKSDYIILLYMSPYYTLYFLFQEKTWMWTDGSHFDFSRWYSRQPDNQGGNQHCLEINDGGTNRGYSTLYGQHVDTDSVLTFYVDIT